MEGSCGIQKKINHSCRQTSYKSFLETDNATPERFYSRTACVQIQYLHYINLERVYIVRS